MNVWLKHRFRLVVAVLLLPSAYFQARGLSYLLGARLLNVGSREPAVPTGRMAPAARARKTVDATPILSRNPFDSVTGPLNKRSTAPSAAKQPDLSDPLHAPECEGFRAESTIESDDPLWSSAVVQAPGEARGKVRRVGQKVGGKQVAYIGFNPAKRSPAVWLVSDATLCQAVVFSTQKQEPAKHDKATKHDRSRSKRQNAEKLSRRARRLPAAIAKGIQRVNPTEYLVRRSAVDALLEDQSLLVRSTRLKPKKTADRTAVVLSRVGRGSLFDHIGLKRGDEIVAINGYTLASPEKALEAYARLRTVDHLQLELRRGGKPVTIDYRIQ